MTQQGNHQILRRARVLPDPYCSWQKGTVENTNKLIRQYIPKKDSFDNYTDKRIMSIQKKLNERPREKLNFSTPKCEFFKHLL